MQPPVPVLPSSFTLDDLALLLAVALVAGVAFLVARRLLLTLGLRLVARANTRLAAALQHQRVFPTLALLAPALIVAIATPLLQRRYNWTLGLLEPLLDGYVIVVIALTVHNLLGALDELITAQRTPSAAAPVRLAFRWLRIANLAVAVILALGVFTGVPVTWLLAVLGVIVATGSIVFGDMIYNLVALSILKQRKLVAKGDWLEVPALQINGQVSEVGAQLIEVQNWDNTLATVPPRYLVSNSFRNWQHMERLGYPAHPALSRPRHDDRGAAGRRMARGSAGGARRCPLARTAGADVRLDRAGHGRADQRGAVPGCPDGISGQPPAACRGHDLAGDQRGRDGPGAAGAAVAVCERNGGCPLPAVGRRTLRVCAGRGVTLGATGVSSAERRRCWRLARAGCAERHCAIWVRPMATGSPSREGRRRPHRDPLAGCRCAVTRAGSAWQAQQVWSAWGALPAMDSGPGGTRRGGGAPRAARRDQFGALQIVPAESGIRLRFASVRSRMDFADRSSRSTNADRTARFALQPSPARYEIPYWTRSLPLP